MAHTITLDDLEAVFTACAATALPGERQNAMAVGGESKFCAEEVVGVAECVRRDGPVGLASAEDQDDVRAMLTSWRRQARQFMQVKHKGETFWRLDGVLVALDRALAA